MLSFENELGSLRHDSVFPEHSTAMQDANTPETQFDLGGVMVGLLSILACSLLLLPLSPTLAVVLLFLVPTAYSGWIVIATLDRQTKRR